MRVISRKRLLEGARNYPQCAPALDVWYRVTKKAAWKNLVDVRRTFSSAVIYKNCTVFNIKGNQFRLIAWINYKTQKVFIKYVLTHADYNQGDWKHECNGS